MSMLYKIARDHIFQILNVIYDVQNNGGINGQAPDNDAVQVNSRPLVEYDDGGFLSLDTGSSLNNSLIVHIADDGLNRTAEPLFYEAMVDSNFYSASTVGNGVRGPDFLLKVGGSVAGTIVNTSGDPVAGVRVAPDVWKNGHITGPGTMTAQDGSYLLGSMPVSDKVFVMVRDDSIQDQGVKYGISGMIGPLSVTAGATTAAPDITLQNAGSIIGQITDENGTALEGVEFEVEGFDEDGNKTWGGGGAYSNSLGNYVLDYLPPGVYRVSAEKDGYASTNQFDVIVTPGTATTNSNMVLLGSAYTCDISGTVTNYTDIAPKNSDGVLLPYPESNDYNSYGFPWIEIIALEHKTNISDEDYLNLFPIGFAHMEDGYDDYFVTSTTENAGNYQVTLPIGNVDVALAKGGQAEGGWYVTLQDWHSLLLTEGATLTNQNFTAPTNNGALGGAINVPDGHNMSSRTMVIVFDENDATPGMPEGLSMTEFSQPTYNFPQLPAGTYTIRAISDGLSTKVYTGVEVNASATTTWPINFSEGGTLAGTVINESSAAIEGARIKIVETGKTSITDSSGNYTIAGITPGSYTLEIGAIAHSATTSTATITANATTTKDFTLSTQVGSISGSITDSGTSLAVNNAFVVAFNETDHTFTKTRTVGGDYTTNELPYGTYTVGVNIEGYGHSLYGSSVVINASTPNPTGIDMTITPAAPNFFITSSVSGSTLSLEIFSDLTLASNPTVSVTTGSGTLGSLTAITNRRWEVDYTVDPADTTVTINVQGTANSLTGSDSFDFDFSEDFKEAASDDLSNSTGTKLALTSAEENTGIEIPPFALSGITDTEKVKMSIDRFGDPGDAVKETSETSVSAVYDFKFDDANANIDSSKTITITMSFTLPDGMTQEEFENDLVIKYFNTTTQEWDTTGISNIKINWVNYTIKFEVNHLTEFAAFMGDATSTTSSSSSSDDDSGGGCSVTAGYHHVSPSSTVANMLILLLPLVIVKINKKRQGKHTKSANNAT